MKLKDFWNYSVLRRTRPAPRGRVDSANPDVIGPGAVKAKALPIPHVRYRVWRAKSGTWEPTVEAKAILAANPDLPIETPNGQLREET
jgi:hypothetical protein